MSMTRCTRGFCCSSGKDMNSSTLRDPELSRSSFLNRFPSLLISSASTGEKQRGGRQTYLQKLKERKGFHTILTRSSVRFLFMRRRGAHVTSMLHVETIPPSSTAPKGPTCSLVPTGHGGAELLVEPRATGPPLSPNTGHVTALSTLITLPITIRGGGGLIVLVTWRFMEIMFTAPFYYLT